MGCGQSTEDGRRRGRNKKPPGAHPHSSSSSGAGKNAVAPTTTSNPTTNHTLDSNKSSKVPRTSSPSRLKRNNNNSNILNNPLKQNGSSPASSSKRTGGTTTATTTIKKASAATLNDPNWRSIWKELDPYLVDPADVPSVLGECLNKQINRLGVTEMTLIQRRMRTIVRALPEAPAPSKKLSRVFASGGQGSAGADETARIWIEKNHQLDESILRKLFKCGESIVGTPHVNGDWVGSAFVLASHLSSEALWDRTAIIAVESASDLVRDVNKMAETSTTSKIDIIPAPPDLGDVHPIPDSAVLGSNFPSVCYLISLALHGSKFQRLQLLFYLLIPPKKLSAYLATHPAGGLPTWLLESSSLKASSAPNNRHTILSLASMSHYYYYGTTFTSMETKTTSARPSTAMKIDAATVVRMVRNLLGATTVSGSVGGGFGASFSDSMNFDGNGSMSSTTGGSGGKSTAVQRRSVRRGNDSAPSSFNGSKHGPMNGDNGSSSVSSPSSIRPYLPTNVAQHLTMVREGKEAFQADTAGAASVDLGTYPPNVRWTMEEFRDWADESLTEGQLETVLRTMFATGILPSPAAERHLVRKEWHMWQEKDFNLWTDAQENGEWTGSSDLYRLVSSPRSFDEQTGKTLTTTSTRPWGGVGGFDGKGGLGYGIMFLVDRVWWDSWADYVGWSWDAKDSSDDVGIPTEPRQRPKDLSNETLLDRVSADTIVPGTLGSYELLKRDVIKGVHYVLVPPGVWDVLYELYGGGPPLPRMVFPPQQPSRVVGGGGGRNRTLSTDSKQMEIEDEISEDGTSVELTMIGGQQQAQKTPKQQQKQRRLLRIPHTFVVATHPWVFHVHLCDASQPYRRGDAGPMSIRVQATPDQPLWRLYAEIIVRLAVLNPRAVSSDKRGKARLWRRMDPTAVKDHPAPPRYGPWTLLCKLRSAILPILHPSSDHQQHQQEFVNHYAELRDDWQAYADHQTVEGIGLANGDRIMMEYAVLTKNGHFHWPRELAAKAGAQKRMAEEDRKFKLWLRGIDEKTGDIIKDPKLMGKSIDAMDASGRWYQVDIKKADRATEDDHTDEEEDDDDEEEEDIGVYNGARTSRSTEPKKVGEIARVLVDFSEFGGHQEWLDVTSERVAPAGRFTSGNAEATKPTTPNSKGQDKGKGGIGNSSSSVVGKNGSESVDQMSGKLCTLPGYGACGLANLGNTCYANSAIQCISYLPLLRSYLISAQYKARDDLNTDNPLGTGGKLLTEFSELMRTMWSGKYGERSPTRFRAQLGKQRSQFSAADQQDAQELLNYLLDALHEDSNKVKKKPYVEALEDGWVKQNTLSRVGEEAWRRFLRRNRSIMADVSMGQVLNTVECPVCHFSSPNFDPFNLLSIPFPTVADVIFQCTVIRRANVVNCPKTLNRPRRSAHNNSGNNTKQQQQQRFDINVKSETEPPSDHLISEQYVVAMSRLADIADLRLTLQKLCGIPAGLLRLCKAERVPVGGGGDKDGSDGKSSSNNPTTSYTRISAFPDKEGPCVTIAKKSSTDSNSADEVGTSPAQPTQIVAFEYTIRPRPINDSNLLDESEDNHNTTDLPADEDSVTADEEEEEEEAKEESRSRMQKELRLVRELMTTYGDKAECRLYDTDLLPISKTISRCLWPRTQSDFKLGLRVDAIDHRDHWFPGSVVEIIEGVAGDVADSKSGGGEKSKKVRVHFDCFSSKWDETYTIEHFNKRQVRPLYSHATPRPKPTEFIVHHRCTDKTSKMNRLFGQPFYLQCQNEWSTARAGAHLLAQASRFMQRMAGAKGPVDVDSAEKSSDTTSKAHKIYEKCHGAISDLIDLLLESDRAYIQEALGKVLDGKAPADDFRNLDFDATALSTSLVKKVATMLHRLPFDVKVCSADTLIGNKGSADEVPFPFSLMRTIGNYMNARHSVVLHWKDPPVEKKMGAKMVPYVNAPVLYAAPHVAVHKSNTILEEGSKKSKNSPGSGGLHLGVCLSEFCKVNKLDIDDNWRCPRCKDFREGKQNMNLWRLPDLLTFHIKRFNCSSRWREKIQTKVNFPLTGFDLSEWCHPDSPALAEGPESQVYDLIGVVNHYGGMTGGHYVALCKATACTADGSEEVALDFNGVTTLSGIAKEDDNGGASSSSESGNNNSSSSNIGGGMFRALGRKDKETNNQYKQMAANAARNVAESAEPLWLQFDDDLVEPIPPRNVVSEMAYVLFYRRRKMTPANIARYSTLE